MWAHNDINSTGLFTCGGMVGLGDGLYFRVGDGVHGYVNGEVRRGNGPSDSWVCDSQIMFVQRLTNQVIRIYTLSHYLFMFVECTVLLQEGVDFAHPHHPPT